MWARRFDLTVTLILLLVLLAAALSGLLADYLGTPRSLYHRLSAYGLAVFATWHVLLRRHQLIGRFKGAIGARRKNGAPALRAVHRKSRKPLSVGLSRRGFIVSGAAALTGFAVANFLPMGRRTLALEGADMGLDYHQWSKPSLWGVLRRPLQWGSPPPLYKDCGIAQRKSLPRDYTRGGTTFDEVVRRRRSVREYSRRPMTLDQLSGLLHQSYGITDPSRELRASPSAGALYPLEIYPVAADVEGLAGGVYHYHPRDHSMDMIREGDYRSSLLTNTGGQDMVLGAGVVLVITAIFQRTRWKYKDRAYRYVLLDAGHLGQNLNLAATSLGLGACVMGAFLDDQINRLVKVDGEGEATLLLVSVGTT